MATKRKTNTKKDLEDKIAQLEAKLSKLSEQLDPPATTKEAPKPAEAKPDKKSKAKESPKEAPKPAETTSQPPTTVQEALENAYMTAPTSDFHHYRATVTGYSPAPNRYFVRGTAPVGKVPTKNWNDQKATVTGYTAVSDQYFATRARMAYHPADKTFGAFSGIAMTVDGVNAQKATAQEAPTPQVSEQAPPSQTASNDEGKSKQDKLSDYEADYLKRLEQQKIDDAKAAAEEEAAEAAAKVANKKRGALPKGFEPKPEPAKPEPAKPSRGTLPKGF